MPVPYSIWDSALYEIFWEFLRKSHLRPCFCEEPEAQASGIADDSSAPGTVLKNKLPSGIN